MRILDRLRTRRAPRRDKELEAYTVAWMRHIDRADDELRRAMLGIATRAAEPESVPGTVGLRGAAAYDLFTRMLVGIEESLEQLLAKRPQDRWLAYSRQHLACDLLTQPPNSNFEVQGRMAAYQRLPRAMAALAPHPDTIGPRREDRRGGRYLGGVLIDVRVLCALLEWYDLCLLFRRRIVLGGEVSLDHSLLWDVDVPGAELPPNRAEQLPIMLVREERVFAPILGNIGLDVPLGTPPDIGAAKATFFFVAGVPRFDMLTRGARHPSDLRIFQRLLVDARRLLEAFEFLHAEIVELWDMSPLEVVAAATLLGRYALDDRPGADWNATNRSFRTRALVAADGQDVYEYMAVRLPQVTAALGGDLDQAAAPALAAKALRQFLDVPRRVPEPRRGTQLRMYGPAPFLIGDGDRLVIDLYAIMLAFSSIVHTRPLAGSRVQKKGLWFENHVRRFLVENHASITSVPSMENEFTYGGTTIGESDVVVRVADTAFVIECKSHRAQKTDDCVTLDEAMRRSRDVTKWVRQARRTAEHLASHPHGGNYDVPSDVEWIVPIVCSQLMEIDWHDPAGSYLIPGELLIFMTPIEILEFISSDRWNSDNARTWQYHVAQ